MTLENLKRLIGFLDKRKEPHYILLPLKEYSQKTGFYKLPRL